ncbi:MAG TPA: heme-binding domain-containing protein [Terriglobales bacterium]|nr:heme-binding domain-containing protein [Terriglobales bacterium]
MKKKILLIVVVALVAIQLYRPAKTNPAEDPSHNLKAVAEVPQEVDAVLARSCNDCHSHKTVWPWYSNVAPVSWFVISDVNDGRRHLNFSEWSTYKPERQQRKLSELCEEVEKGEMPLKQYVWIHTESGLNQSQKELLCNWTKAEQARVTARTGVAVPAKERGGMQPEQKK